MRFLLRFAVVLFTAAGIMHLLVAILEFATGEPLWWKTFFEALTDLTIGWLIWRYREDLMLIGRPEEESEQAQETSV